MYRQAFITVASIFGMLLAVSFLAPSGDVVPEESHHASEQVASRTMMVDGPGEDMEIPRDDTGQFRVSARVNNQDATFLIDTGADTVAIGVDEAEQLGIPIDPVNFTVVTETASGPGMGERVKIERMEVAGREFTDVDAVVIDGLGINLLGQNILQKIGRVELHGDKMTIARRDAAFD